MFNFSLHKYLNRIKLSTINKRNLNNLIPTLTQKIKCLQIFQVLNVEVLDKGFKLVYEWAMNWTFISHSLP